MSGGHFDYKQYTINDIADTIKDVINNKRMYNEEWDFMINDYSDETFVEFEKGLELLRQASIYTQRIDWLISGDDGEESFHKRLKEDLHKLKSENEK